MRIRIMQHLKKSKETVPLGDLTNLIPKSRNESLFKIVNKITKIIIFLLLPTLRVTVDRGQHAHAFVFNESLL
jgi:hypothetical protein